jgi:hypothetical protein
LRVSSKRPRCRRAGETADKVASPHGRCPRAEHHRSTSSNDYGAVRNGKRANVRFGSLADITSRPRHVRFAPNSGHRATPLRLSILISVIFNSLPPIEGDERRRCNWKKRKGVFKFVYFWQSCGTLSLCWLSSLVQRVSWQPLFSRLFSSRGNWTFLLLSPSQPYPRPRRPQSYWRP